MGSLRKRLGRASRVGSVVLLVLSAVLALISYRFQNIVVEVDSVIAFAAGIVLLYRETSHSVQLRVVDRILESSHELTRGLASLNLSDSSFFYVQKGKKVQDVTVVPLPSKENPGGASELERAISPSTDPLDLELVPPGRSLAQLFLREMPTETFSFEDLMKAIPQVISGGLGLASAAAVARTNEVVEIKLLHPVFKNICGDGQPLSLSLLCETCSLFAILICQASGRTVTVENCSRGQGDVSIIRYRLGPLSSTQGR